MVTAANVLTVVQIIVSVAVLLVALGRWGGKIESRRNGRNPMSTSPSDAVPGSNGQPSLGELTRLCREMQEDRRTYVRSSEMEAHDKENHRDHEQLWRAIHDLRSLDNAMTRRIDSLMGQG